MSSKEFLEEVIKRSQAPVERLNRKMERLRVLCEKKGINLDEILGEKSYENKKPSALRRIATAFGLVAAGTGLGIVYHKEIYQCVTKVCEYISNLFN